MLVVDDDPSTLQLARAVLPPDEFHLFSATTLGQGLAALEGRRYDLVLLNRTLPDGDGMELLSRYRERDGTLPVILIALHADSQSAIDAIQRGAFDYLTKPLDRAILGRQIRVALEARRLLRVPAVTAADNGALPEDHETLIGSCAAMTDVYKAIGRAAMLDQPVLLRGERGAGKALAARAVHENSARAAAPYCTIRCPELDSPQLERELFGDADSAGRVEQAAGGTILLEDVAALSLPLQSRLLCLLTTGQLERTGARHTLTANVRILAASSCALEPLVAEGRFRSDLYYLLSSLEVRLPPLCERRSDIPLLVDYYVKRFCHLSTKHNASALRVSPDALELLIEYAWPGNLDELQSVLRQALSEHPGAVVATEALQRRLGRSAESSTSTHGYCSDWQEFVAQRSDVSERLYSEAVAEMEGHLLSLVMERMGGNQAQSARLLGITRGNLRKKLRALGLLPPAASDLDEDELAAASMTGSSMAALP